MHPTVYVLVLFTATILLEDVSGHLFPQAISHMLRDELTKNMELPKDYKRQSDSSIQCVSDKLDAAFEGDNSAIASDCRRLEVELEGNHFSYTSSLQSTINSYYSTFCMPECGKVIIDVYKDCEIAGEFVDFLIGLCGTNQNGEKCYEKFGDGIDQIVDVGYCYGNYATTGVCTCRSELLEAVREQGCCHNVYYDYANYFWQQQGYIKADELYDACNVDLPTGCNNSPIGAGTSGVMTGVALVTLTSSLIFSVVLG